MIKNGYTIRLESKEDYRKTENQRFKTILSSTFVTLPPRLFGALCA